MANRPILRLADDDPLVVVQRCETLRGPAKGAGLLYLLSRWRFLGDSGVDANFQVEQSIFGKRTSTRQMVAQRRTRQPCQSQRRHPRRLLA